MTILFGLTCLFGLLSWLCFLSDKGNFQTGDFIGSIIGCILLIPTFICGGLWLFGFLVRLFI